MKKIKTSFVWVRGVRFRVKVEDAKRWEEEEKKLIKKEWAANSLID